MRKKKMLHIVFPTPTAGGMHDASKGQTKKTTDMTAEAICLAKIEKNSRLPLQKQRRFDLLRGKLHAETLTQSEEIELQNLWQSVEQMNAKRLEALIELSQKRGIQLRALMDELSIGKSDEVF